MTAPSTNLSLANGSSKAPSSQPSITGCIPASFSFALPLFLLAKSSQPLESMAGWVTVQRMAKQFRRVVQGGRLCDGGILKM